MNPELARNKIYKSGYWTKLIELFEDKGIKTNWLHIYIKDRLNPSSKKFTNIIRGFNKNYGELQNHVALTSFLSTKIIIKTLVEWMRLSIKNRHIEKELKRKKIVRFFWPLVKADWHKSINGYTGFDNLLTLNLFEIALSKLPKQIKGIYLQENQGWEFGLIQAWKSRGHLDLIGFPHATVRFWDLRYFFDSRTYINREETNFPSPNYVACNGHYSINAYRKGGYPNVGLVEVESLRYLYLEKIDRKRIKNNDLPIKLLVVGDYVNKSTRFQMEMLESSYLSLSNEIQIIVKPHPNCPIVKTDYSMPFIISNSPLEELMGNCDLGYSSVFTSAAVDLYCFGIPVITAVDPRGLNLSPLLDIKGVRFVSNSNELTNALTNNNYEIETGRNYFTVDSHLPRWKKLLEIKV
jgi:surface carbohydrate biosynthesis protein (TIGR04326 family)